MLYIFHNLEMTPSHWKHHVLIARARLELMIYMLTVNVRINKYHIYFWIYKNIEKPQTQISWREICFQSFASDAEWEWTMNELRSFHDQARSFDSHERIELMNEHFQHSVRSIYNLDKLSNYHPYFLRRV